MTANELSHFRQYNLCVPAAAPLYTASLSYRGVCCQLWYTYLETLLIVQLYDQGVGFAVGFGACSAASQHGI